MMTFYIGLALLAALFLWFAGVGRGPRTPAPEDDVTSGIDHDELAAAEAELDDALDARALDDPEEAGDDWGPGTGGNRGPFPGIS